MYQKLPPLPALLPQTSFVTLTTEVARQLLEGNTANRPLRARYVSNLASAMLRGEWQLNGDAVRVSLTDAYVTCVSPPRRQTTASVTPT